MNILVIITEVPPVTSGVARVCEMINSRLRAAGHVVDTISSRDIARLELGEVRLSSMLVSGIRPVLLGMRKYDLVQIHGPAPTFSDMAMLFGAINRLFGGPPIVYTHHCEIELPNKEMLCVPYNRMHRALARLANHVTVSTPSYADSFRNYVPKERLSVIPWGVELGYAVLEKPAGLNILYVGQLRPYKGLEVLLEAARDLPDAHITVVGSGHRADHYHQLVQRLSLENIEFLGQVTDERIRQAYAQAHVLVLPSLTRAEAFGLVLLEGMAASCIPIASHLPGLTDVVGTVGRSFPVGDSRALAKVIRELHSQMPASTEQLIAVRQWAKRFSWDTTAHAFERLFVSLLHGSKRPAVNCFPMARPASRAQTALERIATPSFGMLRNLFEQIVERFAPSRASLLLRISSEDSFVISAVTGHDQNIIGTEVSADHTVVGWVAARRQPVCITPAGVPEGLQMYLNNPALNTSLSVPLVYNDSVIGVLNVARHSHANPYTIGDLTQLVGYLPQMYQQPAVDAHALPQLA